ncbi:MAG TPA: OmcA/MtrC family decaheme c-type cytochrome [Candidatus Hydrogenedentes bacterium]|nr:OmcA/MtrC family decaheme c-type cytochrome [Candidatus Hydrogenedentota bacterium]HRT64644.1 OmcA/MtrC family decaheme c-type cytochrome [Candidatus Hydrogenedentota bacterium]
MNSKCWGVTASVVLVVMAALVTGCPQNFVLETVTVTATVQGQGIVVPTGGFVKGITIFAVAIPDAGWTFDHWEGDLTGSANPAALLLNGDKAITAVFIEQAGEGEPLPVSADPGLSVEIQSVTIPADLRAEVKFVAKDNKNVALRKSDLASVRFMINYLETPAAGSTARYISYITRNDTTLGTNPPEGASKIQATTDGAGNNGVTDNGDGTLTYKFQTALPASKYAQNLTHCVGGQISRSFGGLTYYANPVFNFRPDGQPVTATRDIVKTEVCNACHTRLAFHGGGRREIEYCILCHTTQSTDAGSGNTLDMATMIHKIHRGENLPSVEGGTPYQIIGHGNSVNDYSEVVFPQDIRNCAVCHKDASQADVYLTKPTLEGCTGCHDRTWFGNPAETPAGYENHPFPQANNAACAGCHPATGNSDLVPSMNRVHRTPEQKSPDAVGLKLAFEGAPVLNGDGTVTISFTVQKGDGSPVTDLSTLSSLSGTLASPTGDYQSYVTETILNAAGLDATNAATGQYKYTFTKKPDQGLNATYAIGLEGRWSYTYEGTTYRQGPEANPVIYFTVDPGVAPVMRREVVDEAQCLACHNKFALHGGQRVSVEYCVLCHNPNKTDEARRPAEQMPPESVNFKDMIHKIHTGEELSQDPYTVYGFGNTPHNYNHVRFPSDRRNCEICHLPGKYGLPLPAGVAPTVITQGGTLVETISPATAACTSCHDSPAAIAHSMVMSPGGVDTCVFCHGVGAEADITVTHQMAP